MKNVRRILCTIACLLFAGMQYATAQVKTKTKDAKSATEKVKKDISKIDLEEDKRIYTLKGIETKKGDTLAKTTKAIEKKAKIAKRKPLIKELDSDDFENEEFYEDELEEDEN